MNLLKLLKSKKNFTLKPKIENSPNEQKVWKRESKVNPNRLRSWWFLIFGMSSRDLKEDVWWRRSEGWRPVETVWKLVAKWGLLWFCEVSIGKSEFLSLGPMGIAPKCHEMRMSFKVYGHLIKGLWAGMRNENFARFWFNPMVRSRSKAFGWGWMIEANSIWCFGQVQMVWQGLELRVLRHDEDCWV